MRDNLRIRQNLDIEDNLVTRKADGDREVDNFGIKEVNADRIDHDGIDIDKADVNKAGTKKADVDERANIDGKSDIDRGANNPNTRKANTDKANINRTDNLNTRRADPDRKTNVNRANNKVQIVNHKTRISFFSLYYNFFLFAFLSKLSNTSLPFS